MQATDNQKFFECEEQEMEIERMQHTVRQHLKDDRRKMDVLERLHPQLESAKHLQHAIIVAIVNSQLRLAYLDGLLFDVRAIKNTLHFSEWGSNDWSSNTCNEL